MTRNTARGRNGAVQKVSNFFRSLHYRISRPTLPKILESGNLSMDKLYFVWIDQFRGGLEGVRIGKCQNWKVSESMFCPFWKILESVRIRKCQNRKVSQLESVRIVKCQNCKVS